MPHHHEGRTRPPAPSQHAVAAVGAAVVVPLAAATAVVLLVRGDGAAGAAVSVGSLVLAASLAVAVVQRRVVEPLQRSAAAERHRADDAELRLVTERAEQDLRDRLDRALRRSESEPSTLRTTLRAVSELVPDADVSLLLASPDGPEVGWSVRLIGGELGPAEALAGTPGCVALAEGSTASTGHSSSLDACGHLRDPAVEVSALCVPVAIGDRALGVVCVETPPGELPDDATTARIAGVIEQCAARVTEQRLERGPSVAGRTDPLTGLPGPSALRRHLRDLVRSLSPFCVAIVDVDDPALPRDPGAADDALLLVAEALRSTLRPDDLICRIDDARFAAVLGQCSAPQATSAIERARENLVLTLTEFGVEDHVTFSAGVVESQRATSLDHVVDLATAACRSAHSEGGNRVTVAEA